MTTLDQIKALIKAHGRKGYLHFPAPVQVGELLITDAMVSTHGNLNLKDGFGYYQVDEIEDQSTRDAVLAKVLERLQNVKTQAV